MERVIHKFLLHTFGETQLEIPANAQVLHVHWQKPSPCIWVMLDPDAPGTKRTFVSFETGEVFDVQQDRLTYIGTWHTTERGRNVVGHVFERVQ